MNNPVPLSKSFYNMESYFFNSISQDTLIFDATAVAFLSGVLAPNFNPLSIRKDVTTLDSIVEQSKRLYDNHQCPWMVSLSETLDSPKTSAILNKAGLDFGEKSVTMFLPIGAQARSTSAKAKDVHENNIKSVNNNLEDWMIPLVEAFESSFEICNPYAVVHARALSNGANFHHFTAYENNRPVSSITLSVNGHNARIDDVSTLPAYQNRGYATALMNHVLSEAQKMGCTHCFLEASDQGLSVYEKIGFQSLFKNHIYYLK